MKDFDGIHPGDIRIEEDPATENRLKDRVGDILGADNPENIPAEIRGDDAFHPIHTDRIPKKKAGKKEVLVLTYSFLFLFLGVIGYLGWFVSERSYAYSSNAYNAKRKSVFETRCVRGSIYSADGEILAESTVDAAGTETRSYPFRRIFAHVVGYADLGGSGIERSMGSVLIASDINPLEKAKNELTGEKSPGNNVYTTLNTKLQKAAYEALGDREGAVVLLEVKTGKVLAMVSKPDFSPNTIAGDWEQIVGDDSNSCLVNRAAQGLYPPGSTFKILSLLEYMREEADYADFSYDCDGTYLSGTHQINCSNDQSHGKQDLMEAFANSCNGAFAEIGSGLDLRALNRLCTQAGYNNTLETDFSIKKSSFSLNAGSDEWEILQSSIGQGKTLVTPILTAMITAGIANKGTMMMPYLVDRVENAYGNVLRTATPKSYRTIMTEAEADTLTEYLRAVVTDGTGSRAEKNGTFTVAGKTGSAQWSATGEPHAWFTGFAPADAPEIAICVLVEAGGSGGKVAAPIAAKVLRAYF